MTPDDMKRAFPDAMLSIGMEDKNLVVLVGDIGHFALQPFAQACPGRYYNIGILEPTIVSMAAGLSSVGLFPVAHTIAPFLVERSFEQIKLDFCYHGLGGNLVSVGSAFDYSTLGPTHHTYNDIALVNMLPNTETIYPASPVELHELFRQTYNNKSLTYMRMARHPHGVEFGKDEIIFGKGIKVMEGLDITLIATGPQLKTIMDAVPILARKGIRPEILYFHTLKPFDSGLVRESVSKTGHVLTIEEHVEIGGLSDLTLHAISNMSCYKFDSICLPNRFLRNYGTYKQHCDSLGFTPENVVALASAVVA